MLEPGTEVKILVAPHEGWYGCVHAIVQRSISGHAIETRYHVGDNWYSEEELAVVVKHPSHHNGNLDALCNRYVGYISLPYKEGTKRPIAIQIGQTVLEHPEIAILTPQQALSLRDWLIQESDRLERLAQKEVENV